MISFQKYYYSVLTIQSLNDESQLKQLDIEFNKMKDIITYQTSLFHETQDDPGKTILYTD